MRPPRDIDDTIEKASKILINDYGFRRSLEENSCVDNTGRALPWYTYPAIEYLDQLDLRDKTVFEYGCGNSSLYWASITKSVTSVESHKLWQAYIRELSPENHTLHFIEDHNEYINCISLAEIGYDIIVIDGMFRHECIEVALSNLKPGGLIIFDNSDRAEDNILYSESTLSLRDAGLLQVDMHGFTPLNPYTATTSFFFHREFKVRPISTSLPKRPIGALKGKEVFNTNKNPDSL